MRLSRVLPTYHALLLPTSLAKMTGLALVTLASTTVMAAPSDATEKLKPIAEPAAKTMTAETMAVETMTAKKMLASESASTYKQLSQQALALNLAEQTTWRRLLYLKDSKPGRTNSPKANTSPVKNAEFFVSPEGRSDPQAELLALLKMMTAKNLSAAEQSKNQAVLCRFPARIHWLQQQLAIPDAELASIDCGEFDAWMAKLDPQRLSVIFAEEYLDNPLSAFGHTLMLIDSTKSLADPSAIDHAHALNDTVAGNPDDNFALYAVKSMTGLYPNDITIDPYPEKLAYYLQGDERDVWQYPLQLSHAEIQQIMRHVWETKDLGLPYYFTTDNCASEILRYIDIVRPEGSLLSQLPYVVVPSDVVRLLTDEALITEQTYLPADDSLRQAKINALAAQASNGKATVATAKSSGTNLDPDTKTYTATTQSALLTLPESLISKDNKLVTTPLLPANNNPNDAHLLQRAMVGIGSRDDLGYLTLGFRAGFNDLLDRPDGYPENFALEGAALSFRVYDTDDKDSNRPKQKSVVLQDLTLIRGRSFNPINSAKTGKTWGLNLGATRVNDGSEPAGSDHLVANAAYEQGVSVGFGAAKAGTGQQPPQLCYALGTGMTQVGKGINNGWRVGVGANLGCRYQLSSKLRAQAEVQVPYWYHGDIDIDANVNTNTGERGTGHYWQPIATLGVQYDIDRNQAIRLQGNYEFQDRVRDKDDVQLAYVKYF